MPRRRKARPPVVEEAPLLEAIAQPQDVAFEVEINSSPTQYACVLCDRYFTTTMGLKRHTRVCVKKKKTKSTEVPADPLKRILNPNKLTLKCPECTKKFKYKVSFERHMKEMHSKKAGSAGCPKCSVRCPSKRQLVTHMATHAASKTQCPHCAQTFTRPYHLVRHLDQKGCDGNAPRLFVCQVCQQPFTRKDNLMLHLRWHINSADTGHQCRECNLTFRTLGSLLRHRMKAHEGNKYICDTCGRSVNSRVSFVKHLQVHGEKNHRCDKCEFRCKSLEILRRHALRHSVQKPFQCLLCPRSFIQAHELTAHNFRHTGHSSIVCTYCGECFSSKATLKSHESRMHLGMPNLYCTHEGCSNKRAFVTEISLRIHMKSHDTNKPYKCHKCEKTFHLRAALSSHVLTHQWERARRCIYCPSGRAYIRGDLLLRHLRIKHSLIYIDNLKRVRKVLGREDSLTKITKQESSAMINMLDALQDDPVHPSDMNANQSPQQITQTREVMEEFSAVMGEEELAENIKEMMLRLIDTDTLECLGWPDSGVDQVLESVLQQCGVRVAETDKFARVTCLRENAKQLFLRVIEDDTITRMMNTKTIDEVIRHVVSASE